MIPALREDSFHTLFGATANKLLRVQAVQTSLKIVCIFTRQKDQKEPIGYNRHFPPSFHWLLPEKEGDFV